MYQHDATLFEVESTSASTGSSGWGSFAVTGLRTGVAQIATGLRDAAGNLSNAVLNFVYPQSLVAEGGNVVHVGQKVRIKVTLRNVLGIRMPGQTIQASSDNPDLVGVLVPEATTDNNGVAYITVQGGAWPAGNPANPNATVKVWSKVDRVDTEVSFTYPLHDIRLIVTYPDGTTADPDPKARNHSIRAVAQVTDAVTGFFVPGVTVTAETSNDGIAAPGGFMGNQWWLDTDQLGMAVFTLTATGKKDKSTIDIYVTALLPQKATQDIFCGGNVA
jgi:hypothetical protein